VKLNVLQAYALAAAALLLAGGIPVARAGADASLPGLKNLSVRVLVDERNPMPKSGTIGWGKSVFRVAAGSDIDLATVNERLHEALRAGFAQKGFVFVEKDPDYLVSLALAAGAEIEEAELNREYGDFLQMPAAGTNAVENLAYKRGVLIVDVVDRKAKHLMWRGAIMAEIDMAWPEARKQERCDAAVGQLMPFFPRPQKAIRREIEEERTKGNKTYHD
jgi:hypothetical protein